MDIQLKQRLVGLTVIFSLAVIFLPMLLDGAGTRIKTLDVEIPPPPELTIGVDVKQKIIELDQKVAAIPLMEPLNFDQFSEIKENQGEVSNTISRPEPEKTKKAEKPLKATTPEKTSSTPTQKTDVKPKPGGTSWVVQTGSYQDKDKAFAQQQKLKKSRISAVFIEQFKHQGKTNFRVRLGPFVNRSKAKVAQNKLIAKYEIKGLIMKHEK